jgi:Ca2+-dependent lipid-binding protein
MAAKKSSGSRRYGKAASKSVKRAMHKRKTGTLKSGAGRHPKVKSREQAIAIGLSEAREKGAKVPRKRSSKKSSSKRATARKGGARKKTTRKKSASKRSR